MKIHFGFKTACSALIAITLLMSVVPCVAQSRVGAQDILGNPAYPAMSYGGYRTKSRDNVPSVEMLTEDLKILSAMGVKIIRTYNTQQYAHAANLLEAISRLKKQQPGFEMYVMLGAWIDCEGAWGASPNHEAGSVENNTAEINAAVALAKKHPGIVKVIAVGNESMVHWAASYYVRPTVVLKWVKHLQQLKSTAELPADLWITSSDNFASWGGGDESYHRDDLTELLKAVDYVSLHTYPFHDTHYNAQFWASPESESELGPEEKAKAAVERATKYAIGQYQAVADYMKSLGIDKPIHIGETGWASESNSFYGKNGSQAADEYKSKLYYEAMLEWTNRNRITCFFFEAIDETWKDADNAGGSENHFGLMTVDGKAKYALWPLVDAGKFKGLTRGGSPIQKTFGGDEKKLLESLLVVPTKPATGADSEVNSSRQLGQPVAESVYVVYPLSLKPASEGGLTLPSVKMKPNVWEGTCAIDLIEKNAIRVRPGSGAWWGCGLEVQGGGKGENLSQFAAGTIHFEIRGNTKSPFEIGFQTGRWSDGSQTNNNVKFGPSGAFQLTPDWKPHSLSISEISNNAKLQDVTSLLYLRGENRADDKPIEVRNVYWLR